VKRLVVVSNRLPSWPGGDAPERRDVPVGGLARALHAALQRAPGSTWLGWNGKEAATGDRRRLARATVDGVRLLGLPLSPREVEDYYRGFCNGTLWPLFHGFPSRMVIRSAQAACYREVNARFASALLPVLRTGDLVWVHDFHLLCLGQELRRLGWMGRIGHFLHIPFPSFELWQALPDPRGFLEALLEYDCVGFQTRTSLENYVHSSRRLLEARWSGSHLVRGARAQTAGVYPVGIDPADFAPEPGSGRPDEVTGELTRVVRGRRLILGVDRLDYTKGIPERLLAFEELLHRHPQWRKKVSFVQIASPSRSRVPEYVEQRRRVETLVGRINGEHAEHDWVPVRYLYRSYPTGALRQFYREAHVGLVTPLSDGMNLVAKEFVAAQDPDDPGVLVLSRLAGAAEDLQEAVVVNPYLPCDVAHGMDQALHMPRGERGRRHAALLLRVKRHTAADWARRFLLSLDRPRRRPARSRG
jgi:trehalose 6-phosphate synthase